MCVIYSNHKKSFNLNEYKMKQNYQMKSGG